MSPDDDDITPEERALFRDSVKGTTPLGHRPTATTSIKRIHTISELRSLNEIKNPSTVRDDISNIALSDHSAEPVDGETRLEYRGSLSHKDMRRLKEGAFPIEAALDLHGSTTEQARKQFLDFLSNARKEGYRCVRIVHGKGKHGKEVPILKNLVNNWLQQFPFVIAFCSAPNRDGGTGAVYVLMRP